MKRIFLSLILTAATLPWATAVLAQQDPSEAPATRPVNPVSAPQKLIFVPDSLKPYTFFFPFRPIKFIDQIIPEEELPKTLTSYSPCFRKEKGAHGIEERGVYRIHQFEKQEMIVVCKPEESKMWFDKLWQNTVDLFRSLDIPVQDV